MFTGDSSRVHRSLGRVKYTGDTEEMWEIELALQAVKQGYACVIMGRGFGELRQ